MKKKNQVRVKQEKVLFEPIRLVILWHTLTDMHPRGRRDGA